MLFSRKQFIDNSDVNDTVELEGFDEAKKIVESLFKTNDQAAMLEDIQYQSGGRCFQVKTRSGKIIYQLKSGSEAIDNH